MWHFVAAFMASLWVFQGFLNGYDNGVGFTILQPISGMRSERLSGQIWNRAIQSWAVETFI